MYNCTRIFLSAEKNYAESGISLRYNLTPQEQYRKKNHSSNSILSCSKVLFEHEVWVVHCLACGALPAVTLKLVSGITHDTPRVMNDATLTLLKKHTGNNEVSLMLSSNNLLNSSACKKAEVNRLPCSDPSGKNLGSGLCPFEKKGA